MLTRCIIVEVRDHLRACNVYILLKEKIQKSDIFQISVKASLILLTKIADKTTVSQKIKVTTCSLIPCSLSNLNMHSNYVCFRLLTEPNNAVSGSFASEVLPLVNLHFKNNEFVFIPMLQKGKSYDIHCKCCSNMVSVSSVTFQRFLPLPSGFLEFEDYFCHAHGQQNNLQSAPLCKSCDCLYGSYYFLIKPHLLKVSSASVIKCDRCLSWIGTLNKDFAKLWSCTVSFGAVTTTSQPLEDFLNVMKESLEGMPASAGKVLIECVVSDSNTHYILLWALDKFLNVHCNLNGKYSAVSESVTNSTVTIVAETSLQTMHTMKVLYKYQECASDCVGLWQNDKNVHTVDVAKQMFIAGLQHLMKQTEYIPEPYKIVEDFFVAYIEL
ncbi:uncharacterized protein LOC126457351 isoform X1 [Schistocerca serialis cubense]|uniref:uncharacterized protein LOC126457351 isoform X1 n=1 Tax=Schistocerca serialis cubense TaxID=2023355 RepID=UPI00214DF70A|nr:uncharacterized protein LOC126457351 isoform X1 [Schistocerca serialis cubense]